jgi:hypothetical protein
MDTNRQAFTHIIRRSGSAMLNPSTPEDRATYKRWARIVLACYCLLFVSGCIVVLANHSTANSYDQAARTSSQKNFPIQSLR